ncbi:hypothetical protein EYC80_010316 [Monilinia laxa]|uniref:Uncharacterized protein n=1 Tax=Monilinia laxa TaxID=61186 RepID=A0A5N6JQ05_MONLA|nr:hypothetical protein EYC80_010316 [Monilinia laxa]
MKPFFLILAKVNRYVHNPRKDYFPILPAATLQTKITKFITAHHFTNDDAEYVQLTHVGNKLTNLQEDHEEGMRVQDRKIYRLVEKLSAVKATLYELDNIYSGSDCKRKRDSIVAKVTTCSKSKERLEEQYLGTVSLLSGQFSYRDKMRNIAEQIPQLQDAIIGFDEEVTQLRAHLRAHRNAIILERRRRNMALDASQAYLALLNEERVRRREFEVDVNQQARIMQQQANWINELEARGMRNEVFDRHNGTWKMARTTRKRRFNADREEGIIEEREIKRERLD